MDEFLYRISSPLLNRIINLIPSDEPVYLVGGAIRDALLNLPNFDLDFVIPGNAMNLARQIGNNLGAAYFPLDKHRNMARLVLKPEVDGLIKGGKPRRIDFSTFQGEDLLHDLEGRDFTMNAMAVEVHQLQLLIDPLGGAADLAKKSLKACSQQSFIDDPVRILRAVRFSVGLELSIHPDTLLLIRQAVDLLPGVSPERLRDELFRILTQSTPSSSIRILDKLNVLEHILPEAVKLKNIQQSPPHIMDAWDHTLDTLVRLESLLELLAQDYNPDKTGNLTMGLAALRVGRYREHLMEHFQNYLNSDRPHRGILILAGLYHDTGKAKTQKVDENGRIRFIEHEHIGRELVEKRGKGLKLSNQEVERLETIVKYHMRPSLLSHSKEFPSKRAVYRFFHDTGEAGVDICILSMADVLATYGPTLPHERWARHLDVTRELLKAWYEERSERIFPTPLVNGDELMEGLKLEPGPEVGFLLDALREAQVTGDIHTQQEAISLAKHLLQDKVTKTG
jgi:poly(A) polymerase